MRVERTPAVSRRSLGLAWALVVGVTFAAAVAGPGALAAGEATLRGTGDLGLVVERALGRVQVIETTGRTSLCTIDGLGDLSHASVVYDRERPLRLRVRPRRRADQGRPAGGQDRRARGPGRQLDRRRHLPGRPPGRGLQLRARRRQGVRCRHPGAGRRHPGRHAPARVEGGRPGRRPRAAASSSASTTPARSGSPI